MQLDLQTLFYTGVTTALVFALVWCSICTSYRWLKAARFWLAGCLLIGLGGSLLIAKAFTGDRLLTHLGMLGVMVGIGCYWQGARVFMRLPANWRVPAYLTAATAIALFLAPSAYGAQNLVYTLGHAIILTMTLATILNHQARGIGTRVAVSSMVLMLSAYAVLFGLNVVRVTEVISDDVYAFLAPWFLAVIILMLSTISLGFLMMTTDSLRAHLASLATRDELTGLYNRRGFRERARRCENSARRRGLDVIMMVIDLDGFKTINDRFGHEAGDQALIHIVSLARTVLRKTDIMARLGGDEFCVLLPGTSLPAATTLANRLRDAIARTPTRYKGEQIPLSASIGLSRWTPTSASALFSALRDADTAMYSAKTSGRSISSATVSKSVDKSPLLAGAV